VTDCLGMWDEPPAAPKGMAKSAGQSVVILLGSVLRVCRACVVVSGFGWGVGGGGYPRGVGGWGSPSPGCGCVRVRARSRTRARVWVRVGGAREGGMKGLDGGAERMRGVWWQ